jgi:hypothetical protein
MNYKKVGLSFVILSLIVSLMNIRFTGAVVGAGTYGVLNLLAVVFFLVGVVMIFVSATLENLVIEEGVVNPSEIKQNIENKNYSNVSFIVDTSFLGSYSKKGIKVLIDEFKERGSVVVPNSVLAELRGPVKEYKDIVSRNSVAPRNSYKNYLGDARKCLEKSRKAFYHKEIVPIILGEKEPPKSRHAAAPYINMVKKLINALNDKGMVLNRENLVKESARHWKVSDTDVDVLATALAEAAEGKTAVIVEKDVDFEDAIKSLVETNNPLRKKVHYVNAYGHVV